MKIISSVVPTCLNIFILYFPPQYLCIVYENRKKRCYIQQSFRIIRDCNKIWITVVDAITNLVLCMRVMLETIWQSH